MPGMRARLACLVGAGAQGALGRLGGELLMNGAIVLRKRPRGRPRKDIVTIGANASAAAVDPATTLPWEPKRCSAPWPASRDPLNVVGLAALLALAADHEGERLIQRARWGGRLECQWSAVDRTREVVQR